MNSYTVPEEIKYKGDKSFIKFKNSEKTGNILSKDVGGMSFVAKIVNNNKLIPIRHIIIKDIGNIALVAMWVKTDSFEVISN
tara:strand:- start:1846 stop:2091 length:246 start_codon:yes stop_codon:yes gene_type:complete